MNVSLFKKCDIFSWWTFICVRVRGGPAQVGPGRAGPGGPTVSLSGWFMAQSPKSTLEAKFSLELCFLEGLFSRSNFWSLHLTVQWSLQQSVGLALCLQSPTTNIIVSLLLPDLNWATTGQKEGGASLWYSSALCDFTRGWFPHNTFSQAEEGLNYRPPPPSSFQVGVAT